jgi:exoribonuclease R
VSYAIADVAAFVRPDSALDDETRRRGVTLYLPDGRAPLHPDDLAEGSASLLPEVDRPAVLWTLDLDGEGRHVGTRVERAIVRSRRARTYAGVQAALDEGRAPPALVLLGEVGRLREALEVERGGVSLRLPAQEVEPRRGAGYRLRYDGPLPVEGWNEQISLLTGMAAADLMLEAGVGLLRTLPPSPPEVFTGLRRSAAALGVAWPEEEPYPAFVARLVPHDAAHAALLTQAARVLRGASYAAFDGDPPEQPLHAAIAAPYAHVTAPLRRLADRFANEVVLAVAAGRRPPVWAREALPSLPATMDAAHQRARAVERAVVDLAEAVVLEDRIGEVFPAMVTGVREARATVQLRDPAVLATVEDERLEPGQEVELRLDAVDVVARRVHFSVPRK